MIGLLITLLLLALLWILMIAPRSCKDPLMGKLLKAKYAHRGLHNIQKGVPENSMLAFSLAVEEGLGIELDVHLSKDGRLVVEHDDTLTRTASDPRRIEDCTYRELSSLTLEGTEEHLPLLEEVFAKVGGKVPLLIEMKTVGGNQKILAESVAKALETYEGPYCVESFDPRVLHYFGKVAPKVLRGQLAGDVRKDGSTVSPLINFLLKNLLVNAISRPDFVAYHYKDEHLLSFRLCRALFAPPLFYWTVKTQEAADAAKEAGAAPIFERTT